MILYRPRRHYNLSMRIVYSASGCWGVFLLWKKETPNVIILHKHYAEMRLWIKNRCIYLINFPQELTCRKNQNLYKHAYTIKDRT